eukprot:1146466-Pelagomonas_calceolata.AAC.6
MACLVLNFISEDLNVFDVVSGEGLACLLACAMLWRLQLLPLDCNTPFLLPAGEFKRSFLAALTSSVNVVFPFLCEVRMGAHYLKTALFRPLLGADPLLGSDLASPACTQTAP